MLDLNGKWDIRDQSGEYQMGIHLPGDIVSALRDADKIPNPYWGRNEYDLRWIGERDWIAQREFDLTDTDCDLVLSGLDTIVDVTVNGTVVLNAQNAFRTYRVDLSDVGRVGKNQIELQFRSPVREGAERQAEQPYFVPYHADNCPIPNGNMLRKAQCDFGWDWNIALAPSGVLGGILIEPHRALRIDGVVVEQQHASGAAEVSVTVPFTAQTAGKASYRVALCGQVAEGAVEHLSGTASISVTLAVKDPELWWPAGQGAQPLHVLTVTLGDETEVRRIGLRQLDLVVEDDDVGTGFKFRVNGRDVFAKGANWIPADALSGRIDEAQTRDLLQSAVDANHNMIRVWGGGRYEPTWFYDICDELGLMVWQDFMFACMMYPATDEFLAEVREEVRENVTRLNHHASMALWCGDNEMIGALTWFPETRANRDLYLVAYDRLNRTLEQGLKQVIPGANWWPSSPSPGYMNFGDAWHDDTSGDMHFWSVWHENKDFAHYRDVNPRFCSEFGFQSYPSMDVIKTFTGPEDRNIAAPILESHQKNVGGNERIAGTMFRYFRFPVDFENFVYLSQVQQGLAIKTAVEYWRSLKPHCMGTLIWQLNDTWPVCSWSSLDYGGGWKLLHHMSKGFYRPVLVTVVPEERVFRLVAVNDLADEVTVSVTAYATAMDGTAREIGRGSAAVGGDATTLVEIATEMVGEDEVLTYGYEASDGTHAGDIFNPHPWKSYALQNPEISAQTKGGNGVLELILTPKAMAFFVTAEANVPGRWDKNAVHIGPGHETSLTFTAHDKEAEIEFVLRDLYSATYGGAK